MCQEGNKLPRDMACSQNAADPLDEAIRSISEAIRDLSASLGTSGSLSQTPCPFQPSCPTSPSGSSLRSSFPNSSSSLCSRNTGHRQFPLPETNELRCSSFSLRSARSSKSRNSSKCELNRRDSSLRRSTSSCRAKSIIKIACPLPQSTASTQRFRKSASCIKVSMSDGNINDCYYRRGKRLLEAAKSGKTKLVLELLDKRVDVNFTFATRWTALHRAVRMNHTDVVVLLLKRGANVQARTEYNFTALHVAAYYDFTGRILALLIGAGADLGSRTRSGRTPLHYAAEAGNVRGAMQLLQAGACVSAVDDQGSTPFDVAKTECVRSLLLPTCM